MTNVSSKAWWITWVAILAGCAVQSGAGSGGGNKAGELGALEGVYDRPSSRPGELVAVHFQAGGAFRALKVLDCSGRPFGSCRLQALTGTYTLYGPGNRTLKLQTGGANGQVLFQGTASLVGGLLTLRTPDANGTRPRIRPVTLFAHAAPRTDETWIANVKAEYMRLEASDLLSGMQETPVRQLPRSTALAFHAMADRSIDEVAPQAWQIQIDNRKAIIVQLLDTDLTETQIFDTNGKEIARGDKADDDAFRWDPDRYVALEAKTAYLAAVTGNGNGGVTRTRAELPGHVQREVDEWTSSGEASVTMREVTSLGKPVYAVEVEGTDEQGARFRWTTLWDTTSLIAGGEWTANGFVWD